MPTFYRIVKTNPPTVEDFISDRDRGRPPPRNPAMMDLWFGLSMFDSEAAARQTAIRYPLIGEFIAAVEIQETDPIRVERTTQRSGHFTAWGEAALLLRRATTVTSVRSP
jgi:hypothetical protein